MKTKQWDQNGKILSVMEVLGFEVFETIILTLIFLGMIFAAYKMIVIGRHFLLKQREKRAQEQNRKFEKIKLQYEKHIIFCGEQQKWTTFVPFSGQNSYI